MISSLSRLTEQHRTLVLDASVALNLLGSGRPDDILRLLGRQVVMEQRAVSEVQRDPFNGRPGRASLDALQAAGLLDYADLSEAGFQTFLSLTGASPYDDLDDGEAATIAHAEDIGAVPVLDDKKAIRIYATRRPNAASLTTLDLLSSPEILSGLPESEVADLVFTTLHKARMRVVPAFRDWVVALIGAERAEMCPSLGRSSLRPRSN